MVKENKDSVTFRTCWGCSKIEEKEEEFKACSKCMENKWAPAHFCSRECLKQNWPRHKEFHETYDARYEEPKYGFLAKELKLPKEKKKDPLEEHFRQVREAEIIMTQNNMEKAERKFQKIIKTEPESPFAYLNLALLSMHMERAESECKLYLNLGLEKCGYALLHGYIGNMEMTEEQKSDMTYKYVGHLIASRLDENNVKAKFWEEDSLLKRVYRYAYKCYPTSNAFVEKRDKAIFQENWDYLSDIYIRILAGLVDWGRVDAPHAITTESDIEEAIAVANIAKEKNKDNPDKVSKYNMLIEVLMCQSTTEADFPFYNGCWVVIRDLKNEKCQHMNEKLGYVHKKHSKRDRYVVQIDGYGKACVNKYNLYIIPLSVKEQGLIPLLADVEQWNYVRPKVDACNRILGNMSNLLHM